MAKKPKYEVKHVVTKKYAAGGVTSANMKKFGRNVARAKNQSGGK